MGLRTMEVAADVDRQVEDMMDASPDLVIASYRRKFAMTAAAPLTIDMIRRHWRIERQGTRDILESSRDTRAPAASRAYTDVFGQCPWLNEADGDQLAPDLAFSHFAKLLGPARRVYEVGSGKGALIAWLAGQGFDCVGTEISSERGAPHVSDIPNLQWHTTDGVNLTDHEAPASFDAVLSVQVIEHLHPDDLARHFAAAASLLRPGGRYVLATPHFLSGPADLSAVFDLERSVCFHLKEYDYGELTMMLRQAGFTRIRAAYTAPYRIKSRLDICFASRAYLGVLRLVETMFERLPVRLARRVVGVLHRLAIWRPDVMLVAEKPGVP